MKESCADHRRVEGNGSVNARIDLGGHSAVALLAAAGILLATLLGGFTAPDAPAKMRSVKLGKKYCQTTGGGRFVNIKQFPGEKIDRRLKRDVGFLIRKYNVFITDGYSLDPVHSANGEHPIGLAFDIVPNFSKGGSWDDIDRLAKWAEPNQNQPRPPFSWVGYDGDSGHGRGHHLHLSYAHSPTSYNKPARTVYSVRCPVKRAPAPETGGGDGSGSGGSGGGVSASKGQKPGPGSGSGGISTRRSSMGKIAPVHPETDGVGLE
jgi:hypothetical protein